MWLVVAAAAAPAAADTLEHRAPVLRYEERERDRLTTVERFAREHELDVPLAAGAGPRMGVAYGRRVRDGGRTWLQYWLLFPYNGQDREIVRTGRHEGDWEMVQLQLGAAGAVETATLTQHSSAERCPAARLELEGERPVVYVAHGSHALYPRPAVHDRPFPDPNDEARGGGATDRPRVERIDRDPPPPWLARDGRWGGSEASFVPGEQPSPRGPAWQGERWDSPAAFAAGARSCGTLPGASPLVAIGAAALLAAVLLSAAAAVRRARADRCPT